MMRKARERFIFREMELFYVRTLLSTVFLTTSVELQLK